MNKQQRSSAFVPHDLRAPITGNPNGPLAGLTAAIKDMYDIAGERTGGGNPEWLAAHAPAKETSWAVQQWLDAGVDVIGKTICDEFFYSVTGMNPHYGTPRNARAPRHLPAGSSSGSAAAVASGACDIALGSDTGGSVRIPAAVQGIYGIRTTHGRVSMVGAMAMAPTFDALGWFASSPGLLRKAASPLLGRRGPAAPPSRLLLTDDGFAEADQPVQTFLKSFLARSAGVLPGAQNITVAADGLGAWRECVRTIQAREVWAQYGPWIEEHQPKLEQGIRERFTYAASITEEAGTKARVMMAEIRKYLRGLISPGVILVLPTAPSIAPGLDVTPGDLQTFRLRVMSLTCTAGLGGLPQVSLPVGTVTGCPVGISFVGAEGADEELLDLAVLLGPYCGAGD